MTLDKDTLKVQFWCQSHGGNYVFTTTTDPYGLAAAYFVLDNVSPFSGDIFKVWKKKSCKWLPGNPILSCPLPTCRFTWLSLTVLLFTVCEMLSRVQLHLLLFALSVIPKVLNELFKIENSLALHVFFYNMFEY